MKNYLFVYNMIIRLYIPYFQDVLAKFQLSEFKIIKLSSFEDDKFGVKLKRKLCYLHVTSVFEDSENLSDMLVGRKSFEKKNHISKTVLPSQHHILFPLITTDSVK